MFDPLSGAFVTPNDPGVLSGSDSSSIQNAVDRAKKTGIGTVCIPAMNARTGKPGWTIDKSILLPSDITVVLYNCRMTMADDVTESFFRTENVFTEWGRDAKAEMRNVHLIGVGGAILDGGKKNALDETTAYRDGNPDASCNHPILFLNVRDFSVENLTILNQRYWGMRFEYCKFGRISNIHTSVSGDRRNQDGINLRNGCNNIVIENITGQTGDDMIALSAIDASPDLFPTDPGSGCGTREERKKYSLYIENADQDIHTVVIRNVSGAAIRHPLVAMRNHNGAKVYNILVENVMDTYFVDPAEYADVPRYALVRIGNNNYWASRPSRMGETYGITIRNLRASYSLRAITVAATLKDCHFSDIGCFGLCETALSFGPTWSGVCGASMENILLDNVCVSCADSDAVSCAIDFSLMGQDFRIRGLRIRHAALSGAACAVRLAGNAEIEMEDLRFDSLRKGPVEYMPRHPEASVSINGKKY